MRFQHSARRYLIDNSDAYNAFMLKKYTGIVSHDRTLESKSNWMNCSGNSYVGLSSGHKRHRDSNDSNVSNKARAINAAESESGAMSNMRVPMQVKMARSAAVAEAAMLGRDAKQLIGQLLREQLLALISHFPYLEYYRDHVESMVQQQQQLLQTAPVQTLTMTGGGMSMGPPQPAHALTRMAGMDAHQEAVMKRLVCLIEDMEEFAMNYAMQVKEACEDHLEAKNALLQKSASTDSGTSSHGENVGSRLLLKQNVLTSAAKDVEALEKRFKRFTGQIENYLGPTYYLNKGGGSHGQVQGSKSASTSKALASADKVTAIESGSIGGHHMEVLRDSGVMNRYASAYKDMLLGIRTLGTTDAVNVTKSEKSSGRSGGRDVNEAKGREGKIARFQKAILDSCRASRGDSTTAASKKKDIEKK